MADLTYAEVGATRSELPRGPYHVFERERVLGGPEVFATAAAFVRGFGMQRGAGLRVDCVSPVARPGTDVRLTLGRGPVRLVAPTRVVYVLDEPDRSGFAYGTLPGHPECGEELFLVERRGESVVAVVRAFSRPDRWFTRAAGPLARALQEHVAGRYLAAVAEAVGAGPGARGRHTNRRV